MWIFESCVRYCCWFCLPAMVGCALHGTRASASLMNAAGLAISPSNSKRQTTHYLPRHVILYYLLH